MSDSLQPHGLQTTRLLRPWDPPGKSTGVGCHFLLQCMKVKSESELAQSCLTPSDPMDCSPPGPSIHEIFQARVLEWGAIALSLEQYIMPHFKVCKLAISSAWNVLSVDKKQDALLFLHVFTYFLQIKSFWPLDLK